MLTKVVFSITLITSVLACQAPALNDLERRARNYKADGSVDPYINDYILVDQWYSVMKHEEQYLMPDTTQIPNHFACGGYEPIYINGIHPDKESLTPTPVDVTVCLKSTFSDCEIQYNISVRICNGEIQYYLVGTKQHASYCFDPPVIQHVNTSKFSDPPTDVKLGNVLVNPILDFDENPTKLGGKDAINYTPYIKFECTFDEQVLYLYSVNWYLNGELYKVLGPTFVKKELLITEKSMHQKDNIHLGFTLKCGVRVSKDKTGQATTLVTSQEYFAGIKILNPVIHLPKRSKATVEFQVTVPVGCRYNSLVETPACDMPLSMFDLEGYKCDQANILQVKNSRRCGLDITGAKKGEKWDFEKVYNFTVETGYENYNDRRVFLLQLKITESSEHKWWANYQPDNIMVVVNDNNLYKDKTCYAHVDPHMQTADGYNYECQEKGKYLMYRNVKYLIEVLVKTDFCNRRIAQCVCHLIIRAGADVFSINICQKPRHIEFLSCADGGILRVVQKNDKTYQVYTPTATYIDITIHGPGKYDGFMNVDIHMSPKDLENVEGLCGYMDGNQANDIKKRNKDILTTRHAHIHYRYPLDFTRSWRLNDDENLFEPDKIKDLKPWKDINAMYCVCEQAIHGRGSTLAASWVPKALCSPTQYLDCDLTRPTVTNKKCNKITNSQPRHRRSARHAMYAFDKHKREAERLMRLTNIRRQETNQVEKRSAAGRSISESEAQLHCRNAINNSPVMLNIPESMPGKSSDAVIDQCTFDVVAGNDFNLANVHVDAINTLAKAKLKLDPVFAANKAAEVEIFIKNSCPGNCSKRGKCSDKGECDCDQYFHGSDCSIDERDPVDIDDLEGGGLCNLTDGDGCECFYFRTNNLLSNFSCAISGVITYIDGTEENISTSVNTGEYEDIFTGLCCAPIERRKRTTEYTFEFSRQYDIAISNDGKSFGAAEQLHVYDSKCQDAIPAAGKGYNITLKDGYCFIDGMCASSKEVSVSDDCCTCEPHLSVYSWTRSCQPQDSFDGQLGVILGATISSVAIVLIGVGLFSIWHFKYKRLKAKPRFDGGTVWGFVGSSQHFSIIAKNDVLETHM